jgi:hypothetical protein
MTGDVDQESTSMQIGISGTKASKVITTTTVVEE